MHIRWLLVLAATVLATGGLAHAHSHDDADPAQLAALMNLYARGLDLAPEILEPSAAVPSVKVGPHVVHFNGPFWELFQGWTRIYYRELQHESDRALDVTEEQFLNLLTVEAKGFVRAKVGDPLLEGIEHIALGTADLGALHGGTAAALKVAAELGETVASKAIGGGGMHMICHVLDAIILFGTRTVQSLMNAYGMAPTLGGSRVVTLLRTGFVASAARRAQRRVRFELGPVEISPAEARALDDEGPRRRRWGFIDGGKRLPWLQRLFERGENHLDRKVFLGSRFKRFMFLRARRTGYAGYLNNKKGVMDKLMGGDLIWILSAQENIIQRGFTAADVPDQKRAARLVDVYTPATDEIREGLAEEYGGVGTNRAKVMEGLLREVEVIYNPRVPDRVRYLITKSIEAGLIGFHMKHFGQLLGEAGELYEAEAKGQGALAWLTQLSRRIGLHWTAKRFGSNVLDVTDYMKTASVQRKREELVAKKFETMDAMKRALQAYDESRKITGIADTAELTDFKTMMSKVRRDLNTFKPWKEKRIAFSWIPFYTPVPTCHDMNQAVH